MLAVRQAQGVFDNGRNNDWGGENCLFSESLFEPTFVPLQVEFNFRFLNNYSS
jgi:hypothetical protein